MKTSAKKKSVKKTLKPAEKRAGAAKASKDETEESKPKLTKPASVKRPATVAKDTPKKAGLDFKDHTFLVDEFACRFNYVLPDYPPTNFDYTCALQAQKLNCVSIEQFNKLKHLNPEEAKQLAPESPTKKPSAKKSLAASNDDALKSLLKDNHTLVYQLDEYPGIFRDKLGKLYDLRPNNDTIIRPSLKTFTEMPTKKLQAYLLDAYKKQLEELGCSNHE